MTDPRSAPSPTPVLVPDLIERLRDDLRAAGWTVESIEDRLGPAASAALHRELALPARRALVEADDPLATLTRLFALGDPVDHDLVEAALPTLGVAGATRLGLLEIEGAAVRASGGVLWRPSPSGPEVAVVHRPRYDDWSLPKGKVDPGEIPLVTAVREVEAQEPLPRVHQCHEDRGVGLRTRVRLDVGEIGAEQRLRTVPGDVLDDVGGDHHDAIAPQLSQVVAQPSALDRVRADGGPGHALAARAL